MQIVTTHRGADFDALASLIAATVLYPGAIPVLPKNVNPNVKAFLSIHKDIFQIYYPNEINFDEVARLIVVDVNKWERLDRMEPLRERKELEMMLWDHHSNPGNILPTWQCQEEVGATVTLLIRHSKNEQKILTPMQATLFLTGIYEDTGSLTFPSATAEDAHAAGYLLEQKADLNVLGSILRPAYGEKQKNVLFEMLQSAKRSRVNGYKLSVNTQEIQGHVGNLSLVVHMYREILNVDAAFGIFASKDQDRCMVIGRRNTDELNIGAIMRSMGGGGHPGAGSAMLKSVNPEAVKAWIHELIEGNQQASVQISDLMSFPVLTVSPETPMKAAGMILREKGCTGVPVVEDDRVVGILSRRDFRKLKKQSSFNAPVKAFMSRKVISIAPGKSPMQAARLMVKHDIGRLPVVENDRLVGIITRSDSMLYFYDLLPD